MEQKNYRLVFRAEYGAIHKYYPRIAWCGNWGIGLADWHAVIIREGRITLCERHHNNRSLDSDITNFNIAGLGHRHRIILI